MLGCADLVLVVDMDSIPTWIEGKNLYAHMLPIHRYRRAFVGSECTNGTLRWIDRCTRQTGGIGMLFRLYEGR